MSMTINAIKTNLNGTSTVVEIGDLTGDLHPVYYGQCGMLTPHRFKLTQIFGFNRKADEDETVFQAFELQLFARNSKGLEFKAAFSHPRPATMSSYEYGHGFAGYMDEAPTEILDAVSEATSTRLSSLTRVSAK